MTNGEEMARIGCESEKIWGTWGELVPWQGEKAGAWEQTEAGARVPG